MTPNVIEAAPIIESVDTMDPGSLREAYKVLVNRHQALLAGATELEQALKGMLAIHDEPAGFVGKYGRALDEAIAAQQVKIDKRIAVARVALEKYGETIHDSQ